MGTHEDDNTLDSLRLSSRALLHHQFASSAPEVNFAQAWEAFWEDSVRWVDPATPGFSILTPITSVTSRLNQRVKFRHPTGASNAVHARREYVMFPGLEAVMAQQRPVDLHSLQSRNDASGGSVRLGERERAMSRLVPSSSTPLKVSFNYDCEKPFACPLKECGKSYRCVCDL